MISLLISTSDDSDRKEVGSYENERSAILYARDYVAKGYNAWLKDGRVEWPILKAEALCRS